MNFRPMNFLFFFINSPRSAATQYGHQMYFGGTVVDKDSTIGIEIYKSSKLRGQRSRSQRDITFAKIRQIINQPGIARFRSNFVQTLTT